MNSKYGAARIATLAVALVIGGLSASMVGLRKQPVVQSGATVRCRILSQPDAHQQEIVTAGGHTIKLTERGTLTVFNAVQDALFLAEHIAPLQHDIVSDECGLLAIPRSRRPLLYSLHQGEEGKLLCQFNCAKAIRAVLVPTRGGHAVMVVHEGGINFYDTNGNVLHRVANVNRLIDIIYSIDSHGVRLNTIDATGTTNHYPLPFRSPRFAEY